MIYNLFNFDHGSKYPKNFSIGPFKIEITEQHCRNLVHLPRKESFTFGWDKDYKPSVKFNPRRRGGWFETAEAIINDKDIKTSVLFPGSASKSSIDDLCLFLSFISGRLVIVESDSFGGYLNPEEYADKVVHYGYFSRNDFPWENLMSLSSQGLAGQFYYLTVAYQSQDFVAKAVHLNNALNVAYDRWYQNHSIDFTSKKLRSKIKAGVQVCLEEYGVVEEIKNDVINRVGNICSPSAIFKLKHFLRGIEIYPAHELPEMHERLKWLNLVRNSMTHTGMLPRGKKLSEDLLGDITSSVVELILRINQYYFGSKLLELDDPYLDYIRGLILPYFYEGKFGGRLIFNEKHEEYMERAKMEWITGDN